MERSKLICPKCGDAMNHHADKLVYPTEARPSAAIDRALGGSIEEAHQCPGCGAIAGRIVECLNPLTAT